MRNLFMIVLCTVFAFVTINALGQKPIKPAKQTRQANIRAVQQSVIPENNNPACWMITGKNGDIEYRWDTEANVKQWINEMRTQHNEIYEYTTSTANNVDACDAKNEKQNPKKCWKITASKNNQGYEENIWSTETVARRKVASLQSNGYQQARYVEISASNEKDCTEGSTEPSCWEITINNVVSFYWGFEVDVIAIVNEARDSGKNATYHKTDQSKDSCIK